eukprot:TRINITY_DN3664_c2_g1_i1.p1 TRINITY_DN3664_c2_g1~~TRINITY_DN3664_c2_g1_i1.p1  ORF type:complete len:165 (-),score=13.40 TRINITY_DN3664_c2_g1_i1:3660-4154(-)
MWASVSAWREQMLVLASKYDSSKRKFKKRTRDLARAKFSTTLINGSDSECISQLRMDTSTFRLLCQILRDKKLLRDTRQVSIEEAVAEFMHTIAHSVRNMTNSVRFFRSGETISRHFQEVLYAINRLAPDYFVQAGPHTPKGPYGFEVNFFSKLLFSISCFISI